jgi:hypothetical protein
MFLSSENNSGLFSKNSQGGGPGVLVPFWVKKLTKARFYPPSSASFRPQESTNNDRNVHAHFA